MRTPALAALCAALASRALASTWCDDLTDAAACVDHTDALGLHTCDWCETQAACHELGSLYNTCSDDCCAGRGSLSGCDHASAADINATLCSGEVVAST